MSEKKERIILDVAYQPQVRTEVNTQRLMLDVLIALIPAVAVAIYQFGAHALLVMATFLFCMLAGVGFCAHLF